MDRHGLWLRPPQLRTRADEVDRRHGLLLAQGALSPLLPAAGVAIVLAALVHAERVAIGYAPVA